MRLFQVSQCAGETETITAKQHRHEGKQTHRAKHKVWNKNVHITFLHDKDGVSDQCGGQGEAPLVMNGS